MSKKDSAPSWPLAILKKLCTAQQLENLYGDVEEMYHIRKNSSGILIAKIMFFRDAFSLIRPFALKQAREISPTLNFFQMIRIYLKSGFRALTKSPMSSFINVFGLTLGMAAVLLIARYVSFELSFDKFHPDYDNIYRLSYQKDANNETVFNAATTLLPVGPMLVEDKGDVLNQVRLYYPFAHAVINIENQSFGEEKPVFADKEFFGFFGFELYEGNSETVLTDPNSIVLSSSLARTYFGTDRAIGKFLNFSFEDGEAVLKVTGIMADPRPDSHIKSNMYISFTTLEQWPIFKQSQWRLPFYHTYIKTIERPDIISIEQLGAEYISRNATTGDEENVTHKIVLQAINDIHLDSHLTFELETNGDRKSVYFLLLVAFITLSIAYLNYLNMATAIASKRAKEVGIKKVLGTKRSQLISQFLVEAFILNFLAFILANIISFVFTKELNEWLDISIPAFQSFEFWMISFVVVSIGAILSGIYPAFVLSGFSPNKVLKGDFSSSKEKSHFRSILVSSQFLISILMIGATLLVVQQTDFLMTKELGFKPEQILILKAPRSNDSPEVYAQKIERLATDLKNNPDVKGFATSGSVPGKVMGAGSFSNPSDVDGETIEMQINSVNEGFFDTYSLNFIEGRSFSSENPSDQGALIINEAASRVLRLNNSEGIVNSKISAFGRDWPILGVIENYHHTSLKTDFEPIIFLYSPDRCVYFSVNINIDNLPETLNSIESVFTSGFPNNPFDYFFLDDSFHEQFRADLRFAGLFKSFATLAVLLASLGLFGLASFVANQKAKELSIRKVLGASKKNVFYVLISDFKWPVLIAIILASSTLFIGASAWLDTFPFRVDLGWEVFALPLFIVITIACLILLYNTRRVLRENPLKRLRAD